MIITIENIAGKYITTKAVVGEDILRTHISSATVQCYICEREILHENCSG